MQQQQQQDDINQATMEDDTPTSAAISNLLANHKVQAQFRVNTPASPNSLQWCHSNNTICLQTSNTFYCIEVC